MFARKDYGVHSRSPEGPLLARPATAHRIVAHLVALQPPLVATVRQLRRASSQPSLSHTTLGLQIHSRPVGNHMDWEQKALPTRQSRCLMPSSFHSFEMPAHGVV